MFIMLILNQEMNAIFVHQNGNMHSQTPLCVSENSSIIVGFVKPENSDKVPSLFPDSIEIVGG